MSNNNIENEKEHPYSGMCNPCGTWFKSDNKKSDNKKNRKFPVKAFIYINI